MIRWVVSIIVLLALLVAVQLTLGWGALLSPWLSLPLQPLLIATLLVLLSYGIRSFRLYAYFRTEMRGRFIIALKIMLQHNLANNFMPMRSGELSFPLLLKHHFSLPLERSLPALLWFRLLDLHLLLSLLIWSLGSQWFDRSQIMLILIAWLVIPWLILRLNHVIKSWQAGATPNRFNLLLGRMLAGSPSDSLQLLWLWGWTALNWLVKLFAFAWVMGLFTGLDLQQSLLGVLGGEFTSVLPVHGIAGAGTYEAGILAALAPFGHTPAEILPGAINLHLFLLGVSLLAGVLSLVLRSTDGD